MNCSKTEKLFALMKQYGVEYLKTSEVEIRIGLSIVSSDKISPSVTSDNQIKNSSSGLNSDQQYGSSPPTSPVEMEIPHHENEVASLLKLSDEDLVDKMFPDYSQLPKKDE